MQNKFCQFIFIIVMLSYCCGCADITNREEQYYSKVTKEEEYSNEPDWLQHRQKVVPLISKTIVLPAGKKAAAKTKEE